MELCEVAVRLKDVQKVKSQLHRLLVVVSKGSWNSTK